MSHADERVLVALVADLMTFNALLLFSDIAPDFIKLQTAAADADHHAVVQFCAPASNALAKAHDRIAMNTGNALSGANALAVGQAGNDLDLLVAGESVHEAHPSG